MLQSYQRERSLSKLRKSNLRNSSISTSPNRQDRSNSNIQELERQWNQVKSIHNQFQNNVSSPLKNKFATNPNCQKLTESQIKNVNIMKLVPHYKINLEVNDSEEVAKERTDYMGAILQKYGNIHKKQIVYVESPSNFIRSRQVNRNDLQEVKRQASISNPKSKPRDRSSNQMSSQQELRSVQNDGIAKKIPSQQYFPTNLSRGINNFLPAQVQTFHLDIMSLQNSQPYNSQKPSNDNLFYQQPKNNNSNFQFVTEVKQKDKSGKLSKRDFKQDRSQAIFKNIVIYPANQFDNQSHPDILSQISGIPKNAKTTKQIQYTPESLKTQAKQLSKLNILHYQDKKQTSPALFKGNADQLRINILKERHNR